MKTEAYAELVHRLREAATVGSIRSCLSWDQETMMPPRGAEFRAEEIAFVSALEHEKISHPRIGELLEACEADTSLASDEARAANLREIRRDHERSKKLPTELVAEIARTSSQALEAWKDARARSDFGAFRPWLDKQVKLAVEKARCYGVPKGGEAYDALLDEYEPGIGAADIEKIFGPLRDALAPLLAQIVRAPRQVDPAPQQVKVPIPTQRELCRFVAERVGFDFSAGGSRLDASVQRGRRSRRHADHQPLRRTPPTRSARRSRGPATRTYGQGLPKAEHRGQPRAGPRAWASTRASPGCGRTRSAGRARSGSGRSRRRSASSARRSSASRWTRSTLP
jgi:carboxypeptidase Taq